MASQLSDSRWIWQCLCLLVISSFLGACTLDRQNLERADRQAPRETLADIMGDVATKDQKTDLDKPRQGLTPNEGAKKFGEEGENQEVAAFKIDLTNFKDRLATLSGAEVLKLMGPPEFERFDPPARIWQYRAPVCVVNLFLYDAGGRLSVEYVELRTRGARRDDVNDQECFASTIQKLAQNAGTTATYIDSNERGTHARDTEIQQTGPASSGTRQEDELAAPERPVAQ